MEHSRNFRKALFGAIGLTAFLQAENCWSEGNGTCCNDRAMDYARQTRQLELDRAGSYKTRRMDDEANRADGYTRDRRLETIDQLHRQDREQRRLTQEKSQEQKTNRLDTTPRDKTLDLQQRLRQQQYEQITLAKERQREQVINSQPVYKETPPPGVSTDTGYDTPK